MAKRNYETKAEWLAKEYERDESVLHQGRYRSGSRGRAKSGMAGND
jgi:hypothetical protein